MQRILGVNISAEKMNASVIDARFRIVKPVKTEDVSLPENRDEKDPFMLETFVRWKKEISPDGIVAGLQLQSFSYHVIDMPLMNREDLRRAIAFELEKYLPLPVDEYFHDFIALPEKNAIQKVIVFTVRRDTVDNILKNAKEAGLKVLSVRCSAISALSGFLDIAGEKNINGLFVNITEDSYEIAGLINSMPVYFKSYHKRIDLAEEIEKLLDLYPGSIYFMGNTDMTLEGKFTVKKVHVRISNALAVSYIKKSYLNLNFLPETGTKVTDYYPYIIRGVAAAVILFFLTGAVAYIKNVRTLNSIESRIAAIKNKASGIIAARKKLDSLQNDIGALHDFQTRSNTGIRALSIMSSVIPNDSWLISMTVDDKGKVEIEGFSMKTSSLVIEIEKSKVFRNVSFTSPIMNKDGEERFALKMEIEGL